MHKNGRVGHAFADADAAMLAAAAQAGDGTRVQSLVASGSDPNAVDDNGLPILQWTMLSQSRPGFTALLASGADPARATPSGRTAIHLAAMADTDFYLHTLLASGAEPDALNPVSGSTPLFAALEAMRQDNVATLLDARANPNATDFRAQSALQFAADIHDNVSVLRLLQHGADPHATAKDGKTFQGRVFDCPDTHVNVRTQIERDAIRDWLRRNNVPVDDALTRNGPASFG